ncbi:hypothetical protein Mterra_00017 [Calidithermus terrae]|uniref:Uncharacterized protein n=2 Tax=Calidithermus terrae TaxID=1408545 RepID=A0A399F6N0_9DEIN|nr:hypothetical protein Mterra_00017 [Calidithermus terrae]
MKRWGPMSRVLLGSLLLLLLVACPGGGAPKLTVSPKTQTVVAGGAPVNFTATLTGASGTITWSLSGPGSISTTTGAGTTYTPPASVASPQTATLTATSGSLSDNATITINPPASITVSGKVIDFFGQGVGGLAVRIGNTTTTTASDGTFSIPNVSTPYDAVVFNSGTKIVNYYKGLTRSDPSLTAINLASFTPPKSASFSGNLSGGAGFPNPANHTTRVFFGSPETLQSGSSVAGPAYGPVSAAWFGPDSTSGNVYALQWQFDPGTGFPIDYKGFGSKALTLSNGGTFNNQDVTLGSLAEDTFSGSVSVPAGYTLNQRRVNLRVAPGSGTVLLTDASAAAGFSYVTPRITGATISLLATASSGVKSSLAWKAGAATNASGVSVSLTAAPGLTVPVNNATGVTINTDFQTTGFSGGVNVFYFKHLAGSNPDIYVITTANTTKIPDLSAIGLGLPTSGAVSYSWQVIGVAPFTSTDLAAGPGGFLRDYVKVALLGSGAGPDADGGIGQSETFNFTTP